MDLLQRRTVQPARLQGWEEGERATRKDAVSLLQVIGHEGMVRTCDVVQHSHHCSMARFRAPEVRMACAH